MDFKVTMTADARELANALIVLSENIGRIKTDTPVLDGLNQDTPAPAPKPKKEKAASQVEKSAPGVASEPEEAPEDTPGEAKKENGAGAIDMEVLREMVQAKSKAGHKTAIVALLKEYKVKTIPDLDPSQFAEFYQKVSAL